MDNAAPASIRDARVGMSKLLIPQDDATAVQSSTRQNLGGGDRVLMPDMIPSVWSALKRADLSVSISRFEGQPNAVLEAMACRCPLVVSDIPAHREFLDDKAALLVPRFDDPESVSNALLAALDDRDAALRRSEEAWRRVQGWSIPLIAQQYEGLYAEVLARRTGVAPSRPAT